MSEERRHSAGELAAEEEAKPMARDGSSSDSSERAINALVRATYRASSYRGILPPAEDLARYNEVVPDGANRLFIMAEKQSDHRIEIEKHVIRADGKRADRGQYCALIVALVAFGVAAYAISQGQAVTATVIGSFDLVALVGVFIYGSWAARSERESKARSVPVPSAPASRAESNDH